MSTSENRGSGSGRLLSWLRGLRGARGGQVAVIFALLLPIIAVLIAGVIDASYALDARTQLQDSTDEAALAVSIAAAQNPNATLGQLRTIAQNALTANFPGATPAIADFHVCAPVQHDCADGGATMANGTVKLAARAQTNCAMATLMPAFCTGGATQTVGAATVTSIKFGRTVQLNIVMDSSASMIVGATPADIAKISSWVSANWLQVKPGDPGPSYKNGSGDNPQCAFACHDESDIHQTTTPDDIAIGLTRASATGATTRYDVMTSAAQQLIAHVRTVATGNTRNRANTYLFNVMSFDSPRMAGDTSLHSFGSSNMAFAPAQAAVASVSPGLDTYLNSALTELVSQIGANGSGGSAASPLKFVVLVTDGLQSDRGANWSCNNWMIDPVWGGDKKTCMSGDFDTALDPAICQRMKNNGVIVGVLETPYVPLTGQSHNVEPYERTVRHVIYPGGPNTPSTVSTALTNCASPGYYFQAVNSSDIATGFLTLTDQFLARSSTIVQ